MNGKQELLGDNDLRPFG